jgi:hypothetical protein
MIESGTYEARPVTAALGMTKGDKPCVGVEFELVETGSHITWYGYFTDKTQERTIESLRFCGWTGTDLDNLSEIGTKEKLTVQLVIEQEEYEGKVRAKVQWVNRGGGLQLNKPLAGTEARAFAARMKGAVLAYDQQKGSTKQATAPSGRGEDVFPDKKTSERPPF